MMIKKFSLFFLYLVLIIYSLEILLFFFIPSEQKNLVNIKEKRLELAKKKNKKFDLRDEITAYIDEQKKNKNLGIPFYLNRSYFDIESVKKRIIEKEPIPFRGPINKQTLSCAEDLTYKLINNDKFGFKNPNSSFEKKIDMILIGDSYAEGLCEDENNDIAGHLRTSEINTINLGVTGSGPLTSLAILREFLIDLNPKYVIYLYFEGNDLRDLEWEKNTYLINYLRDDFNQNYIKNLSEIKLFLENFFIKRNSQIQNNFQINDSGNDEKNNILENLKDISEISNLKGIIKTSFLTDQNDMQLELFFQIINQIYIETKNNESELIFVYLPSWSRYFTKFNEDKYLFDKKKTILNYLKNNKINFIDFESKLNESKDIKEFFPLGYVGHYNSKGYKRISDEIKNLIEN